MIHDASDSRPLDLSDLREADTLGQAWDAWLRDDIEPTRHQASQKLAAGIAATVEELYEWDDAPRANSSFRTGLKRDLLHMHDALRASGAAAVPDSSGDPPAPGAQGAPELSESLPESERPAKARRFRALRAWLPAIEVAAACVLIAALLGVAFANDRIAEFFRDEELGNYAAQGDATENPHTSSVKTDRGESEVAAESAEAGAASANAGFSAANEPAIPISGTLYERWPNVQALGEKTATIPEQIVVGEGYVVIISVGPTQLDIVLSLHESETGNRVWRADVSDHVSESSVGPDATPIIADGKIYFVNRAGFLYIFDIARYPNPDDPLALLALKLPFNTVAHRMLLSNGVLYVAGGRGPNVPSMAGIGHAIFVTATAADAVVEINISNVNTFRTVPMRTDQQDPDRASLFRYDLPTGKITNVWDQPVANPIDVSVLADGSLAVTFRSMSETMPGVAFLNPVDFSGYDVFESGSILDPAVVARNAAVVTLYNDTGDVELRAIQVDGPNVQLDGTWEIRSRAEPIIGGSATIVVTDLDTIQLFDPATGELIGETSVGTEHGQITALDTDAGSVYIALEDGTIVRYDSESAPPQAVPEPMTQPQE